MTEKERSDLLEELALLKDLLDIHLQNPHMLKNDVKSFEEYVNAVLDRINEIKQLLNDAPLL